LDTVYRRFRLDAGHVLELAPIDLPANRREHDAGCRSQPFPLAVSETEILTQGENLAGLAALNRELVGKAEHPQNSRGARLTPVTRDFGRSVGLLFVEDQDVAHWLAVPISPFRRDRHDLPIFGDHESRRPNYFSASLDSRFSRVRVDALKGNGIAAAPPRF